MAKAVYKILIVEDENVFQDILIDRLSKEPSFKIYTSNNGKEGLEAVLDYNPDIVLLDIKMPVMDGISMMKEMKKNSQSANIPIIFLTSVEADDDIIKEINRDKPAYYFIKSKMSLDDIIDKVKATLGINN